jgi:hypothetical protein
MSDTATTYTPCGPTTVCPTLAERLDEPNARRKGFSRLEVVDILGFLSGSDRKARAIGVVFHTSAKDQGLILNFCPWCGNTPLREPVKP